MTNQEFAQYFFLQATLILLVVGFMGRIAQKVGQPIAVGEMIAGIMLGPSVFEPLAPDLYAWFFPKSTIHVIYVISQVGLVLYMFLVGVEFQIGLITDRLKRAVSVSLAGILTPFALGSGLAIVLINNRDLFPATVTIWEGMLFMGSAMSITAFPMLARILHELGLDKTPMGTLALAAAAVDDVVAWCLLAVALASLSGNSLIGLTAIAGAIIYAVGALGVVRPALRWLEVRAQRNNDLGTLAFVLILMLLMSGAFFTDLIGIHAVFGAFVFGLTMPRGIVSRALEWRITPLVRAFLLPLFFVYSGLNTQLDIVVLEPNLWAVMLVVLLVACLGKGIACWLSARWTGEPKYRAMAIGTLMNARGLTELIILNIGLEKGAIAPALFSIMVVMAITTTFMTVPLFKVIWQKHERFTSSLPPIPPLEAARE